MEPKRKQEKRFLLARTGSRQETLCVREHTPVREQFRAPPTLAATAAQSNPPGSSLKTFLFFLLGW